MPVPPAWSGRFGRRASATWEGRFLEAGGGIGTGEWMVRAWRSARRAVVGDGHARPARMDWELRSQSERDLEGTVPWSARWNRNGRADGARLAKRQTRGGRGRACPSRPLGVGASFAERARLGRGGSLKQEAESERASGWCAPGEAPDARW